MNIAISRNTTPITTLPLSSAVYTKALMGDHRLDFTLQTAEVLDIQVGDTLEYRGEVMTVNQAPEVTRNHLMQYAISFEGVRHTLSRFLIKDEGALTFDYTSDLGDFMFMFLESINSVDSGWTVGDLEVVDPFTVSFDKVDHLTALSMIAEACGCEWQMIGKEFSIKKTVGQARAYPLAYGKDNGLYSIKRVSLENSKIVTRAYAVGGTENLPASYPHRQLTLPGYLEDAAAVALYGIREGVIEVPEVYPQRTGSATAVGQINEATFTLTDTTIDFDLNGQRIDGSEAYIVFKSGMLNGQQFKILSYNNATKTIRYEANQDSNGGLLPSGALLADVGDQYTLIGIRMPETYVTAALAELTAKREEYLNSNKVPRVVYEAALDPLDLRRNNVIIEEGDIIPFTDDKIGLDDNLRVTSVSYPALLPYQLTQGMTFDIEIGQEVTYTRIQKIEKDIKETKEVVTQVSKQSWENDRRNAVALREFMGQVFDPDGNMQEPLLQAIAAVFGTTSMYYDLHGVTISVNAGGDENALELSTGQLVHKVYEVDGIGNVWELDAFSQSGLDPLKPYFLSAKVSRVGLQGEWVLTEQQMETEAEPGYWHFNFGVLSSVIEGVRSFRPTKMFTVISGGNIETDSISAYQIDVQRLRTEYLELPLMTIGRDRENVQRFYYDEEQTKTAAAFGIIGGKPQLIWYDESGQEIWNASKSGIVYKVSVPESWRTDNMLLIQPMTFEFQFLDVPAAKLVLEYNSNYVNDSNASIVNGSNAYFYDPGTNNNTEANAMYEGWHTSSSKSSPFIDDGWYCYTGAATPQGGSYFEVRCFRVYQGKINSGIERVTIGPLNI